MRSLLRRRRARESRSEFESESESEALGERVSLREMKSFSSRARRRRQSFFSRISASVGIVERGW